jgi:small subunit ribosomal protein S1
VQNQRLSLGIKQLSVDPWQVIAERYPVGSKIKGEVTSVPDFGVFVRVEEGSRDWFYVATQPGARR